MRTLHAPVFVWCLALSACAGAPILPGGGTGGGAGTGGGTTAGPASVAADVIRLTNDQRARNGLAPLAMNARLMEAARLHASQMASYQRLEHTIAEARYPTMQTRLAAAGYSYARAAENIAWNQSGPQSVVTTWMNSSGHRTNILNAELTQMGAAMARSAKGEPYWIQVFGRPLP
jgi:uncharacterized protein YkwD